MSDLNTIYNPVVIVPASGAAQTLASNLVAGIDPVFDITLTANCTLSLTAASVARKQTITAIMRQDGTAGRALTLPTIAWLGGIVPTFNTAAAHLDVIQVSTVDSGANWLGSASTFAIAALNTKLLDLHDSIGVGYLANGHLYWDEMALATTAGVTRQNGSVSGIDTATVLSNVQAGNYDSFYDSTKTCVAVVPVGTNSLGNGGQTDTQLYATLVTLVQLLKTKGFYVLIATLLPRGDSNWTGGKETYRLAYNTAVRNNAGSGGSGIADGVLDLAGDSYMGDSANATGNTAIYVDGLHPTAAGQDHLAPLFNAAILPQAQKTPRAATPTAPVNSAAPVISGTAQDGQTLTTTNGSWSGYPTPTFTYQWKRGATNVGTNSPSYQCATADVGSTITCVVTGTNSVNSATGTSAATATVIAAASAAVVRLTSLTGMTESGDGTNGWNYSGAGSWTNTYGKAGAGGNFQSGVDGWFMGTQANTGNSMIGMSTGVAAASSYAGYAYGLYGQVTGGENYSVVTAGTPGGATDTVRAVVAGDMKRLRRAGTNVYAEVSSNGGSTWVTLKTWTGASTGIMTNQVCLDSGGGINNLRGLGLA